ncbi:hypothetical protein F4801DRAFT_599454 [Xylaria longipes]|nr:hypothetical protein F4801DRAFT_599454 [Xylaria longipes]
MTVRAWNEADGSNLRDNLIRKFAAVSCFNHFRRFEEAVVHSEFLDDPQNMSGYFDDDIYAMFAKLDSGNRDRHIIIRAKWRRMKKLGSHLSMLARHLGGEGFLVLFPLFELEIVLRRRLIQFHWAAALWKMLDNLLRSTGMGKFFKSMANSVGVPLINKCYGGSSLPRHDILGRLNIMHAQYSLPTVSDYTPRLAPFGYFGSLEARHLASDISLTPLSLLQFVGGRLDSEIVEYLIRQQLPREWAVLGKEDISHPATKELLLFHQPYVEPCKASCSVEDNLGLDPNRCSVGPPGLRSKLVQQVDSQGATETDSGTHIIIDAIAMAKTGKPESRILNEQVCKGLRIKYFLCLINDLQETANKEAMKKTREPK